jgi:hypothetical protein
MDAASGMMWVTFGKSRVRESRKPGSVRAKAEWLSYSTVTMHVPKEPESRRKRRMAASGSRRPPALSSAASPARR